MNRFMITLAAGVLAYMIAFNLGLPAWRHAPVGDATDFGITTAIMVWYLLKELKDAIRLLRSTQSTRSSEGGNTPLMNHGDEA